MSIAAQQQVPAPADLAQLSSYDEGTIVALLQTRYERSDIYTYANAMLIAVNPFAELGLYANAVRRQYSAIGGATEPPPHVFAVAARAFRGMLSGSSQCICVTGESGA